MFLELHILQNFAPSNLNRDDTNAPKHADFGGVRRARVSSQSWKRAMRDAFTQQNLLPADARGVRTKRLLEILSDRLVEAGHEPEEAERVARAALIGLKLGFDQKRPTETQYLVFLGEGEIESLVALCEAHFDELLAANADKKGSKIPPSLEQALGKALDGSKAADVALFGRMLADLPARNVDAAAQVAHAISTHRVGTEFDFFTAVDDLKNREEGDDMGAGMMGTVEFNSACYYRYANLDLDQLLSNLEGDRELAHAAAEAFVRAFIDSIPSGKQNTFAAQSRPTLVLAEYRSGPPQSLADAFAWPISSNGDGGLLRDSVRALDDRYGRLAAMYGDGAAGTWVVTTEPEGLDHLGERRVASVEALVQALMAVEVVR